VVALEPVEAMRRRLSQMVPGVEIVAGTAEQTPFADETFDAVVAGQAFHWFDGDRALPEIHRVLRTHGRLGLLWNVRDESVEWVRELSGIIDPYEGSTPRHERHAAWQGAFTKTDQFKTLHRLRFAHQQRMDPDVLVERVASMSFIAVLPPPEQERVLSKVRHLANTHSDLAGHREFSLPYRTDLYWCVRS
jgi:SAM-dependent methyltransferase